MAIRPSSGLAGTLSSYSTYLLILIGALLLTGVAMHLTATALLQPGGSHTFTFVFEPFSTAAYQVDTGLAASAKRDVVAVVFDRLTGQAQVRVEQVDVSRPLEALKAEIVEATRKDEESSRQRLDERAGGFAFNQDTLNIIGRVSTETGELTARAPTPQPGAAPETVLVVPTTGIQGAVAIVFSQPTQPVQSVVLAATPQPTSTLGAVAAAPPPIQIPTALPTFVPIVFVPTPPTPTPTLPASTPSPQPTATPTAIETGTPTPVVTETPTPFVTETPTPIATSSPTAVGTNTLAPLPTETPTLLPTSSPTPPPTETPSPTLTPSPVPTLTPTLTPSPTPTEEPTPTPTPTFTPIPTITPTPTNTQVLSLATIPNGVSVFTVSNMAPGQCATRDVQLTNSGNVTATTVTVSTASSGGENALWTDSVDGLRLKVEVGGSVKYDGWISVSNVNLGSTLAPGQSVTVRLTVCLATTAGNDKQGLSQTMAFIWNAEGS